MMLGKYGELKAATMLEQIPNTKVEYRSGQSKNDIDLIRNHQRLLHIEVKTSTYKKEFYGEGYGFALHIKKCHKHPGAIFKHRKRGYLQGDLCYFDFLICACLSANLRLKYYIFSRKELEQNLEYIVNESTQYSNSPYRIIIPIEPRFKRIKSFDRRIHDHPKDYENRWDILEKALENQ
jgi:Holliday junction resolvase-like predicted endonuclease